MKMKMKMSKSVADVEMTKLNHKAVWSDYPVGTAVEVVTGFCDCMFFRNERGIVIKNESRYLTIEVKFDEPRHFVDGTVQPSWNFNPDDLVPLINGRKKYKLSKRKRNKVTKRTEYTV